MAVVHNREREFTDQEIEHVAAGNVRELYRRLEVAGDADNISASLSLSRGVHGLGCPSDVLLDGPHERGLKRDAFGGSLDL